MTTVIMSGKAIRLDATNPVEKRQEWHPWKQKGYRVIDRDGATVWHEKEAIRRIVLEAFLDYDADVFLFGSRASGEAEKRSDYDVAYWADHDPSASQLARLRENLEELPIPAHVDIVDFKSVPDEFMRLVLEERKVEIWKRRSKNSIFT